MRQGEKMKVKSFSLSAEDLRENLSHDTFQKMLKRRLDKCTDTIGVRQKRQHRPIIDEIHTVIKDFRFANDVTDKRIIVKNGDKIYTVPYGSKNKY